MSSRVTGRIVTVGVLYWWTVFLAMHVLEPEFSPLTAPASAYVLGAYGAWMTTTYFVLAAVLLSAGFGLTPNEAVTTLTRIARGAFLIAAAGAVLAGLFRMDWPPPPRTLSGRLHALGGVLTFLPWVVGTLLFSLRIRRDHRWASRSGTLMALSVLSIGMVAVLPVSIRCDFAGVAQRLLLTLLFAWLIVVASQAMRSRLKGEEQPNGPAAADERRRGAELNSTGLCTPLLNGTTLGETLEDGPNEARETYQISPFATLRLTIPRQSQGSSASSDTEHRAHRCESASNRSSATRTTTHSSPAMAWTS